MKSSVTSSTGDTASLTRDMVPISPAENTASPVGGVRRSENFGVCDTAGVNEFFIDRMIGEYNDHCLMDTISEKSCNMNIDYSVMIVLSERFIYFILSTESQKRMTLFQID